MVFTGISVMAVLSSNALSAESESTSTVVAGIAKKISPAASLAIVVLPVS